MRKKLLSLVAALTLTTTALADLSEVPSGAYELDPQHGYILFSYTHLGFSNPQVGFNTFTVDLDLDPEAPQDSTVEVTIDAGSVDSRVPVFDGHLNGADWLDTENHPEVTFVSTEIERTGDDRYVLNGNLTVKGITRPVTLDATINAAGQHPLKNIPAVGISASGTVLRSEFGLDGYVPAVTDELTLTIEVEMLKVQDDKTN